MWASDSIHLRETLFVPLRWTSKEWKAVPAASSQTSVDRHDGPSFHRDTSHARIQSGGSHPVTSGGAAASGAGLITRRIPASELSFFPSSSGSNKPNGVRAPLSAHSDVNQSNKFMTAPAAKIKSSSSNAPSRPSLAGLFSSLQKSIPISIPSPDKFSRISADSYFSSSNSSLIDGRSASASIPSDDAELGLEMDTMPRRCTKTPTADEIGQLAPSRSRNARRSRRSASQYQDDALGDVALDIYPSPGRSQRQSSHAVEPMIRTKQLEPSPMMKYPAAGVTDPG